MLSIKQRATETAREWRYLMDKYKQITKYANTPLALERWKRMVENTFNDLQIN